MGFLEIACTALVSLAVLTVPGLPSILALRLRPLTGAAFLPPASLLLVTLSAELGSATGIPWNVGTPLALGTLLGAALWLGGRQLAPRIAHGESATEELGSEPGSQRHFLAAARCGTVSVVAGILLGGGVILLQALRMLGSIRAVSQTYDNVFHLNATRHILRSGDGSAWVVGGMTQLEGQAGYYPALWHQTASLVTQLSTGDIVLSSNILMLTFGVLVWPVSIVALVRTTTPTGPVGWFLAGALSGISVAMPLTLMGWGLVLPYFMAMTMMPTVVLAVAHIAQIAPEGQHHLNTFQLSVLTPVVLASVTLSHPQSVFVGIVLCLPIMVWATGVHLVSAVRRVPGALYRLWPTAVLTLIAIVGTAATWTRFSPPQSSAVWGPNASRVQALGQVLSLSPNETPTWEPFAGLMSICALVVLIRTRSRWLVVSWIAGCALSFVARSEPAGDLRYLLTGNWYSDSNRITAIPIVVAVPLLAIGLDAIIRRAARSLPIRMGNHVPAMAIATAIALIVMSIASPANRASLGFLQGRWQMEDLLSADERELLERLPEVVPEDAVIATNAWNGSSLAYAISDRPVLNTYMGFAAEPEVHLLNARLDEANTVPEVCDAAEELDVEFALDFGPQEIHGRNATYTGLNEISETGAAEVVMQVGEAKLLRMLPCRGVDGQLND